MDNTKYYVVKKKAVPEVLLKVVEAKKLLESERVLEGGGTPSGVTEGVFTRSLRCTP